MSRLSVRDTAQEPPASPAPRPRETGATRTEYPGPLPGIPKQAHEEESIRIMEYMRAGGCIMWVILALSLAGLAVFLDRLRFVRTAGTDPVPLEERIGEALYRGDAEEAARVAASGGSSLHRLFASAVGHWETEPETLKLLMEQEVRRELYRWEKGLSFLGTVGRLAPLLGLLGTVLGMVEVFRMLPQAGGSPMTTLAGGIWKALLTTVAGLTVAVPAVLGHTYLASRADRAEEMLERGADFLLREKLLGRGAPGGGEERRP
jgi:biopolymer transport protein ExbB